MLYTYPHYPKISLSASEEEVQKEWRKRELEPHTVTVTPKLLEKLEKQTYSTVGLLLPYNQDMTKYHTFCIPKRSGGYRKICAPYTEDARVHKTLLKQLYSTKQMAHRAAHGFVAKRNCKTALQVHQRNQSRWFLKLDIKDFFPSCKVEHLLAMREKHYLLKKKTLAYQWEDMIKYLCADTGGLVQGSPCSPYLSNILMLQIDHTLYQYFRERSMIYTRYADDLLISSRYSFDWKEVQSYVQEQLNQVEMKLNTRKIRYGSYAGRNWNLGLMYNQEGNITIGNKKKRELKHRVHNWNTRPEERTSEEYAKLLGALSYASYIEPHLKEKFQLQPF